MSGAAGWIYCGIPIVIVAGMMVTIASQQRKLQTRIDQVRFTQVPELRGLTPPGAEPAMDALTAMGFTRIGEAGMYIAGHKDPAPAPLLVSADKRALAIVSTIDKPPQPAVSFETLFADGFALYTAYPRGMTVSHPYLRTSTQPASIDAALAQHTKLVGELEHQHGSVYLITSLSDRGAWWSTFGTLHKDDMKLVINPVTWLLPPLVIMIISAIAWNTPLLPAPIGTWVGVGGLLLLTGWVAWNIKRGMITFTGRKPS
jgi:hypothetical protein